VFFNQFLVIQGIRTALLEISILPTGTMGIHFTACWTEKGHFPAVLQLAFKNALTVIKN